MKALHLIFIVLLSPLFLQAADNPVELTFLVHLDNYPTETEGLVDIKILEDALASVKPFSRYSAALRIRELPFQSERLCSKKKAGPKDLLECSNALIDLVNAQGIDKFKLVVLSKEEFVPNAKVARGKNSSIFMPALYPNMGNDEKKDFMRKLFLHEVGHAFGLRDEYGRDWNKSGIVDSELASLPSNNVAYQAARPNCAPDLKTAREWWGESIGVEGTGYYSGCSGNMKYVRPSEDKLMSAYAKDISYGYVSENYLDQVISCFYLADDSKPCRKFRKTYPKFWQE